MHSLFYFVFYSFLCQSIYLFSLQVIQAMEQYISPFTEQLSQLFLATMKDDDDEVVSNSIFALGVLAESAAEAAVPYLFPCLIHNYPVFEAGHALFAKEAVCYSELTATENELDRRSLTKVCSRVCF